MPGVIYSEDTRIAYLLFVVIRSSVCKQTIGVSAAANAARADAGLAQRLCDQDMGVLLRRDAGVFFES